MRSIEFHFKKSINRNQNLSSYMNLVSAVKFKKFAKDSISRAFTKFVDKEDYISTNRPTLVDHLYKISHFQKPAVDNVI